uniref:Uncharacterized protein n=1 Tax=Oncorhynchus tshawytscha TaxID=74940 RepID=A0A8C8IA99_ONCTS
MEDQLHVKRVTEKLTESLYVLHFRMSLPGLVLHEVSGAIYTVEYACTSFSLQHGPSKRSPRSRIQNNSSRYQNSLGT